MTHLGKAFLLEHFPHIYATCLAFGIDMAVTPIPVVPAAHYVCGGVCTDFKGRTSLAGLPSVGPEACPGLHRANPPAPQSPPSGPVFRAPPAPPARPPAPLPPRRAPHPG